MTKIVIPDHIQNLRDKETQKVNEHFAQQELAFALREQTYHRKRAYAKQIMDGNLLPETHPFVQEAKLRGLPQEELARDVLYKPDITLNADHRELARQRILIALSNAKTKGELAEIMYEAGLSGT